MRDVLLFLLGFAVVVVPAVVAIGIGKFMARAGRPIPGTEPCEHYDLDAMKACPKPATHELSAEWLEPDQGPGAGTSCTAYFCRDHAPVGAQRINPPWIMTRVPR